MTTVNGAVMLGFIHGNAFTGCFVDSLLNVGIFDALNNQRLIRHDRGKLGVLTGAGKLHSGRNELARSLCESDAEWLFMVDTDMGFDPDTVERLIASADPDDRPIVGALAFAGKRDGLAPLGARRFRCTPTVYNMRETEDELGFVPVFDYPRDALVEVDATGAACILIHRTALEKMRSESGDMWFNPIIVPGKGEHGFTEFGEDMSFCLRAKAAGFPLHVDTSIKTTHDKGGVFFDEDTYDLQQVMREFA